MEPGAFWQGWFKRFLYRAAIVCSILVLIGYVAFWFFVIRSPEHQWKLANTAFGAEQWQVAEVHLRNVITSEPADIRARLALANVYREIDQKKDQPDRIDLNPFDDEKTSDAVDPPGAIEQLLEIRRLDPEHVVARLRLLDAWRRTGRIEAATDISRELVSIGSEDPRVLYIVATDELDKRNWDAAARLIARLKGKLPEKSLPDLVLDTRLNEGLGKDELINATLPESLQKYAFEKTLQLEQLELAEASLLAYLLRTSIRVAQDPTELLFRCEVALSVFDAFSSPTSASELVEKRVALSARFVDLLVHGFRHSTISPGKGEAWQQFHERRRRLLTRFVELAEPVLESPNVTPFMHDRIAQAAINVGDDARAIQVLQTGLQVHSQLDPKRQQELLSLHRAAAERLIAHGKFDEAQVSLQKLLARQDTAGVGHLLAGYAAFQQQHIAEALSHLTKFEESGLQSVFASALLCSCRFAAHDWKEMLEHLNSIESQLVKVPIEQSRWVDQFLGDQAKRRLLTGYALVQTDQHEAANDVLLKLEKTEWQSLASLVRATSLLKTDRRSEALTLLREALHNDPDNGSLVVAMAGLWVEQGERRTAEFALQSYVDSNPQDVIARVSLARLLIDDERQQQRLLDLLADVRRTAPQLKDGWTLAAGILLKSKDKPALNELLQAMKQQESVAYLTPLISAHIALRNAGLDEAALALDQAGPELRNSEHWIMVSAYVALGQGDASKSLELYSTALQSDGQRSEASQGFLRALALAVGSKNTESMRQQVEKIRKQWPEEPVAILASLVMAAKAEDFTKAYEELGHLEKHDTDTGRPHFWRATLLSAQGKMKEALSAIEPAIDNTPGTLPARMLGARIAMFQDRPAEGLKYLGSVSSGESIEGTLLRAEMLRRLSRVEEAARHLEQLVERNPDSVRGWLMLSRVYQDAEPRTRASITLERGLAQLPENVALHDRFINLLIDERKVDEAQRFAGAMYQKSPRAETAMRLAGLFLNESLPDQADVWLGKARETSHEKHANMLQFLEATSWQKRGETTGDRKSMERARTAFERMLTDSPHSYGVINNLAWLQLRGFDDSHAAAKLIQRIRSQIPDRSLPPGILDTVVETLRATGKSDEALALVTKSLLKYPDEALLRFHYGVLLKEQAGSDRFLQKAAIRELERATMLGGLSTDRRQELSRYLRAWRNTASL